MILFGYSYEILIVASRIILIYHSALRLLLMVFLVAEGWLLWTGDTETFYFLETVVFTPQQTNKYALFGLSKTFIISHLHTLSTLLIQPLKDTDGKLIEN